MEYKPNEPLDQQQSNEFVRKYISLVRPYKQYKAELSECRSITGRFQQYFVYGKILDCSKWSHDAKNSRKCLEEYNNEACISVIMNETERRLKRITDAKKNDVWKKREKPPENWNFPLPQYFLDRNPPGLFHEKAEEFYCHVKTTEPTNAGSCVIL